MNVRTNTMKFLEKNIGGKPYNIGFGNDFLDMTLKAQAKKEKKNKFDFKMKNFCASKDTSTMKRHGRAYLQFIQLIKDWYSEHRKNSSNSATWKQPDLIHGQRTLIDISLKVLNVQSAHGKMFNITNL